MKRLFFFLFLLTVPAQAGWVEGTVIGVPDDNPKTPNAFYFNDYTGAGPSPGVWTTVDVSANVPSGTKAIFLGGILIVTHGTTVETCDLRISFRKPGTTYPTGNYLGQTIEAISGSGQRSTMFAVVPVDENGQFQYMWEKTTSGTWPTHCSNGGNFSIQGYVR